MKLEHFFLGICALLLAGTGLLAMHYRTELLLEKQKNELSKAAPSIPSAPAAAPAVPRSQPTGAPSNPGVVENAAAVVATRGNAESERLQKQLDDVENEKRLLAQKMQAMQANKDAGLPVDAAPLTDMQVRIKEAPAIAKVKNFVADAGIAVLDHGKDRALNTGQVYAVRRGHYIVAKKLVIGETVDDTECAASVDNSALQPGEVLKPGDEVIKWE